MKIAERIVMSVLVLVLIMGGVWLYMSVKYEQKKVREAVARGEFERPIISSPIDISSDNWRALYPVTVPLRIGEVMVEASVADTLSARIQGLSGTPFLPENVVKLFAFGVDGNHSIWMKDMNYSLDIMWATQAGDIVHIEENVSPETYPKSFSSPVPAWYVVEANAGFVERHKIVLGDKVVLPVP
jgi:uncharacterized membrane protein (UPF0127 family)